jgi:uncharacterized protein YuzE
LEPGIWKFRLSGVYETKQVRPVFAEEVAEIVVITVLYLLFFDSDMKISYESKVDALSFMFRETTVITKHLAEGIAVDYDSEGRLAGLAILDAQNILADLKRRGRWN